MAQISIINHGKNMIQNIAYIDGTNLYKGLQNLSVQLDYKRFRVWLLQKYRIKNAYIFMGYIPEQKQLYKYLKKAGFILIFKESVVYKGNIKGNADSEIVLQSVRDFFEKEIGHIVLVSGDGDFSCLVDFLIEKKVFKTILIPNSKYCSYLLRKKQCSLTFLDKNNLLKYISIKKDPR